MNPISEYQHGPVPKVTLAAILVGPDESRRQTLARALEAQHVTVSAQLSVYPSLNLLSKLTEGECDAVLVDLDSDPDQALDLVENVCSQNGLLTVMVYSRSRDPDLLVKCMRSGAREFLNEPVSTAALAEAVIRASARRTELDRQKKLSGKVLVFWGTKGGAGVTTIASNFAIALRRESDRPVALADLHPDLGDVAVTLGLAPRFTLADALNNAERLDQDFLAGLLTEHSSGIGVLAAPDEYSSVPPVQEEEIGRLLYLLRDRFPYVVVDAGPGLGAAAPVVLEIADVIYLVTQVEIPALRNGQRLIAHLGRRTGVEQRVEVVLNRYDARKMDIEEGRIAKALALPLKWKIPNDFSTVHQSLNTGSPLVLQNSPVTRVIYQMAREACGKPAQKGSRKRWGLFD